MMDKCADQRSLLSFFHPGDDGRSLLGLVLSVVAGGAVDVRALRALRVLRPLRLVTSLQSALEERQTTTTRPPPLSQTHSHTLRFAA